MRASVGGTESNRLRACDRAFHDWYRFVLSFPPHLVRDYAQRFGLGPQQTVLDPFCGTGTTLVECKKLGIGSVGLEPNPLAHFASGVKVDWAMRGRALMKYADTVADLVASTFSEQGVEEVAMPLFAQSNGSCAEWRRLPDEQAQLLLRNSISPLPLHRTLVLLDAIDECGTELEQRYARLALAKALVQSIGNLKFGPEVGVGKAKQDAPALSAWLRNMRAMADDLDEHQSDADARVLFADSRAVGEALEAASVDAVITSPPYPNEKDYTRTVRLESVLLGFIRSKQDCARSSSGWCARIRAASTRPTRTTRRWPPMRRSRRFRKRSSGGGWNSAKPPASSASTLASPSSTSAACAATWRPCVPP